MGLYTAFRTSHDLGGLAHVEFLPVTQHARLALTVGQGLHGLLDRGHHLGLLELRRGGNRHVVRVVHLQRFQRIRVVPPLPSEQLADLLRSHDVYLAASRDDPCSNALLEGLACGLPAAFLRSGGHPELVGEAGKQIWVTYDPDDPSAMMVEYSEEDLEYTWSWFEGVRDIYAKAAERGRAVLFTVDQ